MKKFMIFFFICVLLIQQNAYSSETKDSNGFNLPNWYKKSFINYKKSKKYKDSYNNYMPDWFDSWVIVKTPKKEKKDHYYKKTDLIQHKKTNLRLKKKKEEIKNKKVEKLDLKKIINTDLKNYEFSKKDFINPNIPDWVKEYLSSFTKKNNKDSNGITLPDWYKK